MASVGACQFCLPWAQSDGGTLCFTKPADGSRRKSARKATSACAGPFRKVVVPPEVALHVTDGKVALCSNHAEAVIAGEVELRHETADGTATVRPLRFGPGRPVGAALKDRNGELVPSGGALIVDVRRGSITYGFSAGGVYDGPVSTVQMLALPVDGPVGRGWSTVFLLQAGVRSFVLTDEYLDSWPPDTLTPAVTVAEAQSIRGIDTRYGTPSAHATTLGSSCAASALPAFRTWHWRSSRVVPPPTSTASSRRWSFAASAASRARTCLRLRRVRTQEVMGVREPLRGTKQPVDPPARFLPERGGQDWVRGCRRPKPPQAS